MDQGDEPSEEEPVPELCDLCGVAISNGAAAYSLVPDSSVLHARDPNLDGQRVLVACSPDHLGELQERYRQRPFVNEELWAGKIGRATQDHPFGISEKELVEATGLNLLQIERAVAWQRERRGRCE